MSFEAPTLLSPPNEYDVLFDPTAPEPPTDPNVLNRMVEASAVRPIELASVLARVEKDDAGLYRPDEMESQNLISVLGQWEGFGGQSETEDKVQVGISKARQLVASGQAPDYLHGMPFINDQDIGHLTSASPRQTVRLIGNSLVVTPNRVVGANSFSDWQGRGDNGSGEVAIREGSGSRRSIDQISDYATRDSALPSLNDVDIFLTDNGAFVYAGNSHRAAAAKLRNESLKISSFAIFDLRGKAAMLDEVQKLTLADMQSAIQNGNT